MSSGTQVRHGYKEIVKRTAAVAIVSSVACQRIAEGYRGYKYILPLTSSPSNKPFFSFCFLKFFNDCVRRLNQVI